MSSVALKLLVIHNNGWYVNADHRNDQKGNFPKREVHIEKL